MSLTRLRLVAGGQVQGVGFRPTVYRLARTLGLSGNVRNSPDGVVIEVQGGENQTAGFAQGLHQALPPLARVTSLRSEVLPVQPDEQGFVILPSTGGEDHHVLISPDTATCADCLAELFDPNDRRHHYPFINCTNCGPRLTITRSVPYDRPKTSMACFAQCPLCQAEYEDPLDRRFHAQPNCCPVCGPQVWLADARGNPLADASLGLADASPALELAARALARDQILAVKGLGGFHLICAASSDNAVLALRRRKQRWGKPLALLAGEVGQVLQVCTVSDHDLEQLTSPQRPIVLLPRRENAGLSPHLAPDTHRLGVMLAYTPLHHVLLRHFQDCVGSSRPALLVATSANLSSEPIALGNREALRRLGSIADMFVLHNRDILIRCDDSVLATNQTTGQTRFFRRARGFTPAPIFLAGKGPCVLGLGPELKTTICLTKGDQAFVSQHIGDLQNMETLDFYQETVNHLQHILHVRPEAQVADLHPDYLSTGVGRRLSGPLFQVQHHVAHIHAVLAENQCNRRALGLALDGAGLGPDQTIWGGEALLIDPHRTQYDHLGSFAAVRLPGGEVAAREPWRMACSYLHSLGLHTAQQRPWPWLDEHAKADSMVRAMLVKELNSPWTSSCGRLFDAVAGLLGLCHAMTYEGQAAIILEGIQRDAGNTKPYACPMRKDGDRVLLDCLELFSQVHEDWIRHVPVNVISRRFHLGLVNGLADWAAHLARAAGVQTVGLSGGVMQNATISELLPPAIGRRGLQPLVHTHLPPNDACISLGQAAYGRIALRE
jgi:hydrogenase maturation protein HypF